MLGQMLQHVCIQKSDHISQYQSYQSILIASRYIRSAVELHTPQIQQSRQQLLHYTHHNHYSSYMPQFDKGVPHKVRHLRGQYVSIYTHHIISIRISIIIKTNVQDNARALDKVIGNKAIIDPLKKIIPNTRARQAKQKHVKTIIHAFYIFSSVHPLAFMKVTQSSSASESLSSTCSFSTVFIEVLPITNVKQMIHHVHP